MRQRWAARWREVVAFWDEREAATPVALVRIGLALCWLYDLLYIWHLGLVRALFAPEEFGGFSNAMALEHRPLWFSWMGADAGPLLHGLMTAAAIALLLGFRSRLAAGVLLAGWLQWVGILPTADRGIDQLSRHMLLLFVFADSGRTLAVDCWVRTGRWIDRSPVPSWPRKLVIAQMVLMYFTAGVLKTGLTWWPMGSFAALFFALHDPSVAAFDFGWTVDQPWFFFTQIGTATTILYQSTYPLVLVLFWWRRHPERAGRLGRWCNQWPLEWVWLAIGAWFHLSLGVVMNLGIFPWAMLALYPAWLTPQQWEAVGAWMRHPRWRVGGAV